jgi:hypothetical protein
VIGAIVVIQFVASREDFTILMRINNLNNVLLLKYQKNAENVYLNSMSALNKHNLYRPVSTYLYF